jgi:uncharacterized protein YcbK (DUF882 family)
LQNTRGRSSFFAHRSVSRVAGAFTALSAALAPSFTESAVANGDTRTLYLYHTHTHEHIAATYLVNGQYDQAVLKQLNWFLRDWRRDEATTMDPRLFDVVWEAYRQAGANEPINVVSAYRSPETNAMLRRRSRAVAKYSQHMLGKAMDTTIPGMSMSHIREIGMRMQRGGVGYYPNAGTPFVHLDVGSVRSWPRMSYEQLVRLFPDGKTVHLPSNNQPLARYEEARAEIEARGNGAYAPPQRQSKSFLAFLFGGGEEDEDSGVAAPPPTSRKQWASLAPRAAQSADAEEEGASVEKVGRARASRIVEAERNLPRGETTLSAGPAEEKAQAATHGKLAAAPQPPMRPLSVAALEQPSGEAEPQKAHVDFPVPPRRPTQIVAEAPLPPSRPTEFALASSVGGAAFSIRSLGLSAPEAKSARVEAPVAKPEPLLAYAPAASEQSAGAASKEADAPAIRPAAARTALAKAPASRADVAPARLDRSNFHVMTAATPTSRISSGSALGSTISAPRSAARAEPNLFAVAPAQAYARGFVRAVDAPPTDRFVGR